MSDLLEFYNIEKRVFTGTHMSGMRYLNKAQTEVSEVVDGEKPEFYSVYITSKDSGMQCVADFYSKECAEGFKGVLDLMLENYEKDSKRMKRITNARLSSIKPEFLHKGLINQMNQLVLFYDNPKGKGEILALIRGRMYDTGISNLDLFFDGSDHNPIALNEELAMTYGEFDKGPGICEL